MSQEPRTVSWKLVLGILFGLPLLMSFAMWSWLGTSRQGDQGQLFARMHLEPVPAVDFQSIEYQEIWFGRMELEAAARERFLAQLGPFETSTGRPEGPLRLKLKREWWDIPRDKEGRRWARSNATIWSTDDRPDVFYMVVTRRRG